MMASATAAWVRRRLAASGEAFSATARNPGLLRAQLSFGAAWTAEAAFTVALGVVAFVDGGAEAVGLVAFARMVPAALFTPVGTAFADRFPRDRVLVWSCLTRAAATGAAAAVLLAGPSVVVYPLAVVSTCAFRLFRPAHSALLPGLCKTPREPRNLSRLRIAVDALA